MNEKPESRVDPATVVAKQRLLIRLQLLLIAALIAVVLYAKAETHRADMWRAHAVRLQARLDAEPMMSPPEDVSKSNGTAPEYYKTTLIGEDGSRTPLNGKAIQIEQGGGRLLEVFLKREDNGWLHVWAPARKGEQYFNWPVFRPHCANVFSLQLDRVKVEDGEDGQVAYAPPR